MPEPPPRVVLLSAYFLAQVSGFSLFFKICKLEILTTPELSEIIHVDCV